MSKNIQKRIGLLQPYVTGIRFHEGYPVVDAIFKEGWIVPQHQSILKAQTEGVNEYYMFYSDDENIGLDELLDYCEYIISVNNEREQKYEFLKIKVNELKQLFKKTPLTQLVGLKFVLAKEELIPEIMPTDMLDEINVDDMESMPITTQLLKEPQKQVVEEVLQPIRPVVAREEYDDDIPMAEIVNNGENTAPIDLTNTFEDEEIIHSNKIKGSIEMPPRGDRKKPKVPVLEDFSTKNNKDECTCPPDEFCDICIPTKALM